MKRTDRDYDYDEDVAGRAVGCAIGIVYAAIAAAAALAFLLLAGCSPKTVYIPVENTRTEYRDREVMRTVADTVSSTRLIFVKGDTVYDRTEKERIHRLTVHDTCYIERHDTTAVPCPVERKLSPWQRTKLDYGGYALAALVCLLAAAVTWLARRIKQK